MRNDYIKNALLGSVLGLSALLVGTMLDSLWYAFGGFALVVGSFVFLIIKGRQ